jgi:EamA domain-containing membrane protein RarD
MGGAARMTGRMAPSGLSPHEPSTWLVLALSGVFIALGLLFVFAPRAGAALFGIAAPEGPGLSYVSAIGLRDLAFGAYLAALSCLSTQRAVGTVLGLTVLIPIGDVILVFLERGFESPKHLLLHAGSGLVMAISSLWLLAQSSHDNNGGTS